MRPMPKRQRGMGVIELMVALLIGLIMSVAIAWFYLGSRALSRVSEDVSRLQESGRGALEMMGMSVRQAGYRNNINASFNGTPLTGTNGANGAPDTITVRFDAQEGGGELDCTGATVVTGATVESIFTVDRTTNPPGLNCNGTRLIDNVEDMQISYGIDADHDGIIESYQSQPSATEFFFVAAVRVSLLLRGPSTMIATNKTQTLTYNGALVQFTDGYLRQAYNATFTVRPQAY